jgi:hypothetical protein
MQLVLDVVAGARAGQRLDIDPSRLTRFGRADFNDFVFADDPLISGAHFSVELVTGRWRVRDLGSTNGTFVNGVRSTESTLADGDEISAGSTKLLARLRNAESDLAQHGDLAASILRPSVHKELTSEGAADSELGDVGEDDDAREILVIANKSPFIVGTMLGESAPGRGYVTVVIKATFAVGPNGNVDWSPQQLPLYEADVLEDPTNPASPVRFESDMVPFKPRADVVLVGRACAPGRPPVQQLDVRLCVGSIDKTIRVFGDRHWSFPTRLTLTPRIDSPVPFREMELTYTRAFGGIDEAAALYCDRNLAGVGFIGAGTPASMHGRPLPNLENPDEPITTWDSRPAPVGFGFYGRGWMPRLRMAGTFDEAYRRERSPLPPEDFNYAFYNGAHPDLQMSGYLRGGEAIDLYNLHPEGPLHFLLPWVRPLVVVKRYAPSHGRAKETAKASNPAPNETHESLLDVEPPISPHFDTLVLIPEHRMFYEVFRCAIPLESLEAIDVHSFTVTLVDVGK